jgi:cell division septation protein DedD
MNQASYIPHLYQMIMDLGKISIDGLGTFSLSKKMAAFGLNKATLSPPSTSIVFEPGKYSGKMFSKALIDAGLSSDFAMNMESTMINDYNSALSNNTHLTLEPLGSLSKNGFVPNEPQLFNRFEGLKPIDISPLPHNVERSYIHESSSNFDTSTLTVPSRTNTYGASSGNWLKYLAPLLLGISTLFIIGVWYQSKKWIVSSDVIEAQFAPKPTVSHSSEADKKLMLDTVDKLYDEKFAKDAQSTSPKTSSIIPPVTKPTSKKDNKPTSKSFTPKSVTKAAKTPIAVNEVRSADPKNDCVLILGAFKQSGNATRMLNKINTKGYKSYVSDVNGLRRVGVVVDCAGKDVDSFKNEIRKKLNSDSWQLKN